MVKDLMECTLIKHFSSIFKWLHWGYEIYIERVVSMLLLPHLPIQGSQQNRCCYYLFIIWWGKTCYIPCRKVNPFSSSTLNTLAGRNYVRLTLNKLKEFFCQKKNVFLFIWLPFFFLPVCTHRQWARLLGLHSMLFHLISQIVLFLAIQKYF